MDVALRRLSGVLILVLTCALAACANPNRSARELTRTPTPWEVVGDKITELERTSLVRQRFGCEGCTKFVSNMLIVQPDGAYRVYDVTSRTERARGSARPEVLAALTELLASPEWRALPEGDAVGTQSPPWLEIRGREGHRVRRLAPLQEGAEPTLDRAMTLLDAVMMPE